MSRMGRREARVTRLVVTLAISLAFSLYAVNSTLAQATSIDDVSVAEGDTGTTNVTFTVTLTLCGSGIDYITSGQTVTMDYVPADNTATGDISSATTSGTLTFSPGETTTIDSVCSDMVSEADEPLKRGNAAPGNP